MVFFVFLAIACGSSDSKPAELAASNAASVQQLTPTTYTVSSNPKATEGLATADAADGVEDKVAHKCAGCALGMDGNADHAISVDGTTLHLCSSMCKENYVKDVEENLESLVN